VLKKSAYPLAEGHGQPSLPDEIEPDQIMLTNSAQGTRGAVVVLTGQIHEAEHERAIHFELAQRLARLQGLEFLGEYAPSAAIRGVCISFRPI
jgi:hypothetical protein